MLNQIRFWLRHQLSISSHILYFKWVRLLAANIESDMGKLEEFKRYLYSDYVVQLEVHEVSVLGCHIFFLPLRMAWDSLSATSNLKREIISKHWQKSLYIFWIVKVPFECNNCHVVSRRESNIYHDNHKIVAPVASSDEAGEARWGLGG